MKTIEWVFVVGAIAIAAYVLVYGGLKFRTPNSPQYGLPHPNHPLQLSGMNIHQVDFVPPQFTYPNPKHPFQLGALNQTMV